MKRGLRPGPPSGRPAARRSRFLAGAARTPETDRRVAIHEAGHATAARILGSPIAGATIVAGPGYSGRVWGPDFDPLKFADPGEIIVIAANLRDIMPAAGIRRADAEVSPIIVRAHAMAIELLSGTAAERALYRAAPPLPAQHDQDEARAYGKLVCYSERAINLFIEYARSEAAALIDLHRTAVLAIADALVSRRTLNGEEIDRIIADAHARDGLAAEKSRREVWARTVENAARAQEHTVRLR